MKGEDRWTGDRSRLTMAIAVAALFAISATCSGCLFIAIPSLAYQGYKYESGGQSGQSGQTGQSGQAKQHQNAQPPTSDDVE